MNRSNSIDRFTYWLIRDRIPLVKLLILSNVVTFFLIALGNLYVIEHYTIFDAARLMASPWTLLTYTFLGSKDGPISLLFAGYWLWIAGGSLERSWGSTRFAAYFFTTCVISALGLFAGAWVTRDTVALAGLWLPLSGVTIAFAMLNPEQQILFFFVIPLKLKYLALLDVGIVLVAYGRANPLLGVMALAGCAYSYWYVRGRRAFAWSRGPRRRPEVIRVHRGKSALRWLNPLNWYREYRDRKRLRDLFDK